MKLHSIVRTRNINVAIFAMAVSLLPVIQSPMAFAEEISFDCPGGGKYIVADGVLKGDYDNECLGDVVFDDSVTTLNYVGLFSKVTSVTIPATVETIENQPLVSPELVSIEVDSSSENFTSIDGVLYSKDEETLILYPANKAGESYTIPDGVTTIMSYAFGCLNNLKNLTLSDSVTEVNFIGMVNGCNDNSLESYIVGEGNESYSSIDGVLFDKEATLQISYPKSKSGENYDMVSSVTKLQHSSFGYNQILKTVKLSENLETIDTYSFSGLNLATLHIPASVQVIAELGLDSTNSVTVDPENPNFVVSEGNLFNPDMTTLLVYFNDDSRTSYTVPSTVTSLGGYAFGNNDARSLVRLTFNTPLEEAGTVTGGPTKFLNLGNDFKLATHFENSWYFRELKKVNYCGNDAETIKDLNAQIAANWTTATLVCESASPALALSSESETVEVGSAIKGYTLSESESVDVYSISPEPSQYGFSFDAATGLLSGAPAYSAISPLVFTIKGSNAIGDTTATYSLTINDVPVVIEPTPEVVEPTPEPIVPISEVVEPTPVVISPVAKSTYFAVTTSSKNLSKITITKSATSAKIKLGKSLQFKIASVGKKAALVKVSVKDPSGKSYQVASKSIAKNKSYSSPIMKFSKVGKYTITTFVGSAKKVITVTVSK